MALAQVERRAFSGFRRPANNIYRLSDNDEWRERRQEAVWEAMETVLVECSNLFFKLGRHVCGQPQHFTDKELMILRSLAILDSEYEMDDITRAAVRGVTDPRRR